MKQLFLTEPKGNFARLLTKLTALVAGIIQTRSGQLSAIERKTPNLAKSDRRIKRYSWCLQNERIEEYEGYYMPIARELFGHLLAIRELIFVINESEVGHERIMLMINLIYGKRVLLITWLVVKEREEYLPGNVHFDLLAQLREILPKNCQMVILGDEEFNRIDLQPALQARGGHYVYRTTKNTTLYEDGQRFSFENILLQVGDQICILQAWFTQEGHGPVTLVAQWKQGFNRPIYLVTNFELPGNALYWHKKRLQIETFFPDEKSRGFYLQKSYLVTPKRLSNLMIAACLAYL